VQKDLFRTSADFAMLNSLNVLVGLELDDNTRLTLSMLRLLVGSRLEPGEAARTHLLSMSAELDDVIALASLPIQSGAVYGSVAQSVVRCLQASGALQRNIDSSDWSRLRTWSFNPRVGEREALIAHLASRLYAGLLSITD
jgi:hypothetical protein